MHIGTSSQLAAPEDILSTPMGQIYTPPLFRSRLNVWIETEIEDCMVWFKRIKKCLGEAPTIKDFHMNLKSKDKTN